MEVFGWKFEKNETMPVDYSRWGSLINHPALPQGINSAMHFQNTRTLIYWNLVWQICHKTFINYWKKSSQQLF